MFIEPSISSGQLSTSAAVMVRPGALTSIHILPPASATLVNLTLYDNKSAASGNILWSGTVYKTTGSLHVCFVNPICVTKGIYASLSVTQDSTYVVAYSQM